MSNYLIFSGNKRRRNKGCQRYRQHHTDTGRDAAYDLQSDESRRSYLIKRHVAREEEYHKRKLAAQEGQDQGVCHGPHHIAPYIHTGAEELLSGQRRVGRVDLLQR